MGSFAELAKQIDVEEPSDKAPQSMGTGNFAELAKKIDVNAPVVAAPKPNIKEQGYFSRVGAAAKQVARTVTPANLKPALGEAALASITGGPVALLKHGVEEGAYLASGHGFPTFTRVGDEAAGAQAAARVADRVIPTNGYQPTTPAGQAVTNLAGTVFQPLVDAGRWAAEKAGLSPAAQNIAGDLAPVAIPNMAGKVYRGGTKLIDAINNAPASLPADIKGLAKDIGSRGSLSDMQARYAELVKAGRAPEPVSNMLTPQQLRGQEPLPETPAQPGATAQRMPDKAPPLTVENASPQLQKTIQEAGPNINPTAVTRQLEADSLPIRMRLSEGQATDNLQLLSDEFNKRGTPAGKPYAELFNEQNGHLIDNLNAIRDKAAPKASGFDHVENGETIIKAYENIDEIANQNIGAKYKALEDANGGQFPLDGKQFVDAADAALAKKLKSHYVPPEVRATLNDVRNGGTMTFEDFETLRTDLAEVGRSAKDGNTKMAASIIREQLENLPMPPGAEHLKPLADAARGAAKARFDAIKADPAYKAAVEKSTAADKFVQKYIVNGNKDDLARMNENLAGNPDAQQSIAAGALNYLKSRAGIVNDRGNFNQVGYNKALEALKPKKDYLFDPVTAQQVQTLGNVANYVLKQPRGSYFNNSNTAVSLMRDAALGGAEGVVNAKTFGGYGAIKEMIKSGKEAKAAQKAVQPGAGIPLKDLKD
jgi:hypothetical protein